MSSFKKEQHIGELLAKELNNKIYNDFDTVVFNSVFNRTLADQAPSLKNSHAISSFYIKNEFKLSLITKFYANKNIDSLVSFLQKSSDHGINPVVFSTKLIDSMLKDFRTTQFSNVKQSYLPLAKLEILIADSYISYVSKLSYGVVNPKTVFSRYFIEVKQPDTTFLERLLNSSNMLDTLKKVQPKNEQYKVLQVALKNSTIDSVSKILAVNMERLRWILPQTGKEFVQVNIPAYNLTYFKGKDTLSSMNVCVGAPADDDYDLKLKSFQETGNYENKPKNHETPMLFSFISQFYTNPVWNIPESIACNEIYTMASHDSYYLTHNNINVYYKNKRINNPAKIRWAKYDRENLPFRFIQGSGPKNSLGRFKFAFKNNSSIFLHDTNNKKAFKFPNRAISHGCIRLERPLEFAKLLVDDDKSFGLLKAEIGLAATPPLLDDIKLRLSQSKVIKTTAFTPKKPIPLLITYFTAWAKNNKVVYVADVYDLDKRLWVAMGRVNGAIIKSY